MDKDKTEIPLDEYEFNMFSIPLDDNEYEFKMFLEIIAYDKKIADERKTLVKGKTYQDLIVSLKHEAKLNHYLIEKGEKPTTSRDPFALKKSVEIIFDFYPSVFLDRLIGIEFVECTIKNLLKKKMKEIELKILRDI